MKGGETKVKVKQRRFADGTRLQAFTLKRTGKLLCNSAFNVEAAGQYRRRFDALEILRSRVCYMPAAASLSANWLRGPTTRLVTIAQNT